VREGIDVPVSEGVRVGDFVEEGDGVSVSEGLREREEDDVSEEVGVRVDVSEEVREGDQEGDSVAEEVFVGEGLADSDTEGLGDTGPYETEKTGSPCAFVAMSIGLVNWMSVVVFAGTATPVEVKST
jgi:hypothetical protein